eukprot:gene3620-4148_t
MIYLNSLPKTRRTVRKIEKAQKRFAQQMKEDTNATTTDDDAQGGNGATTTSNTTTTTTTTTSSEDSGSQAPKPMILKRKIVIPKPSGSLTSPTASSLSTPG